MVRTVATGHRYTETDFKFAKEVAGRAAVAIDNARLYKGAQSAIAVRYDFFLQKL